MTEIRLQLLTSRRQRDGDKSKKPTVISKRIIARNAAALMVSEVGVRVFSAIGVVLVARSLGPRAYGVLSVALALSGIVAYLSDLGLTHLTIQHATRPNADMGCILGTIFKVRLVLVIGVALASLAGILVLYPEPEQRAVMLAVVLPSIGGVAMQGFAASYFWATQELHVTAGLKTASQVLSAIALILAFFLRWPVRGVAAVYGTTSLLGGIACLWLVRRRAPKMGGWDPGILKGLTAFTVGGLTGIALPQLGPLIMERVTAATEVGYFAAASRIPGLLYAIPGCLGMAWYPQLFLAGSRDHAQHFALCVDQLKINAILSFGLSLPVALYSGLLIRTVLGSSWEAPTAPILSLLCWMVVLNSLSSPFADALTTKGLQTRRACVYVAALAIGSVLFAALASTRGALGAAAAAIITQTLLSVGLVVVNPSGRALLLTAGQRFLRSICLASACVFVIHMLLPDSLISAALSVATFFLVAVASDIELRTVASRVANIVYAKWRYACATP
jgi:O-antigen/teichoic acid export membrane protein